MYDCNIRCAILYVFYYFKSQVGEHIRSWLRIWRCVCMRVCANMHDINTNNYFIHTHINASFTSTYDNIRLITNMFKLKMTKFVSTLRYVVSSPSIRGFVWYILSNNLIFHSEVGHVYSGTFNECTQMYVYVQLHTTMYDILQYDVQQCLTMYFPTTEFWSHPKVLHVKPFFKFAALPTKTSDSLRTTAINHDNTRKTTTF